MTPFYKPHDGWAADFIPLYAQGAFHLFYLKDYRDPATHGEGTPWFHLSTTDFVHFEDHGEALARGAADAQDLFVFTGSAIHALGQYHIFYTGHNPHLRAQGKPEQAVMHAVSDDLVTWRKVPEDTFFAPAGKDDLYEPHDWRDPFVFFDAATNEYGMLLAARLKTGPSRRRGCTALCTSKDLKTWTVRDSFWTPGLYFTHECPDLFQMGEWWYLVFSEFSERCVTRYRMSRSPAGPWLTPPDDTFDGRAYYAAKTASDGTPSDGTRRFVFGWNPTRIGEKDDGAWQWGGNLVVHELVQHADGTLAVQVPDSVDAIYSQRTPVSFTPALGDCTVDASSAHLNATGTATAGTATAGAFACATAGSMPERFKIEATLSFSEGTQSFGVMLRADDALEAAYYLRFEPHQQRMVFDAWPRPGDRPYWPELERPLALAAGQPIPLKIYIEGSVCEIYVNDTVAMSTRLYNLKAGQWGVFASEGSAVCERAAILLPT